MTLPRWSVTLHVVLWILLQRVDATWVGTLLLPHGDFAYDPSLAQDLDASAQEAAHQIAASARRAGEWLEGVQPDVILLTTPHGIQLEHDFGLYMATTAAGVATIGNDLIPPNKSRHYNVRLGPIPLNSTLSQDLNSIPGNLSAIYSYSPDSPMPLEWGEIIPLYFLKQLRPLMILSMPHRRYQAATEMVPELLRLGQSIQRWIDHRPERIAIVVSGDLSHTHWALGPYGYSPTSALYDAAMGEWARNPCGFDWKEAQEWQRTALSCGFTGHLLWHGMLSAYCPEMIDTHVWVNRNVTYYGMMVAMAAPVTQAFQ